MITTRSEQDRQSCADHTSAAIAMRADAAVFRALAASAVAQPRVYGRHADDYRDGTRAMYEVHAVFCDVSAERQEKLALDYWQHLLGDVA